MSTETALITIKSKRELGIMRQAGRIVAEVHAAIADWAQPGVTTLEIDRRAEAMIRKGGGTPSFKGYRGFPGSVCASINEEIVHGIPSKRELQPGDLFKVDIGVCYKNYHGDSAWTYAVGGVSAEAERLRGATRRGLEAGIAAMAPGGRIADIARAVESVARKESLGVVRQFVGHGIGSELHEEPQVPNYVSDSLLSGDVDLEPGMVLAIEPMFNLGTHEAVVLADGWTVVTADGRLSAHFEHTVAVTENGPEILTRL